jgi:hypothetical protein
VPLPLSAARALVAPQQLAVGRTLLGLTMLAAPRLLPTTLGTPAAVADRVTWVVQMLGAREVALGLGSAYAVRAGGDARAWLAAGLLCDAVDAVALAAAAGSGRVGRRPGLAVVAVAGAAVVVQAAELARR